MKKIFYLAIALTAALAVFSCQQEKDADGSRYLPGPALEIIAKELVSAKLLKGVSGKGGGYKLSRKPEEYPVGEILDVMENSMAVVSCLENGAEVCPRAAECDTLPMWSELNNLIHDFLYSKKLSDLL